MKKKAPRTQNRSLTWFKGCAPACAIMLIAPVLPEKATAAEVLKKDIALDIRINTPLNSALAEWGRKSGLRVSFDTNAAAHVLTRTLRGNFSAKDALTFLLRNSGLTYIRSGNTIHIIGPAVPISTGRTWHTSSDTALSDMPSSVSDFSEKDASDDQSNGTSSQDRQRAPMDQVIVTAQRRAERLQDTPITVSVLSGNDLDTSSFASTKDALTTVPGMFQLNDITSGGTELVLRGVSAPGGPVFGGSTPVAYYLDGVPVAFVRSAIVPDTNVYDLDRIEVLSGPQGTLYGASALAGVVRILTNDADLHDFDFKGRASLSTTDHGGANNDGSMAVNIPLIDGKLAARLVAGTEHESGWIDDFYVGNHLNDVEDSNVRLKLNGQPTETLSFGITAWHSSVTSGNPPEAAPDYTIDTLNSLPDSDEFNAYSVRIENLFQNFSLTSTSSYFSYKDSGTSEFVNYLNQYDLLQTWLRNRAYTEELALVSTWDSPWKWSLGAFYRNAEDLTYQNLSIEPGPTQFLDAYTDGSKSKAIFGELTRGFFQDRLKFSAGIRYFRDDEDSHPDPPAQLTFIPGSGGPQSETSTATTPRGVVSWNPTRDFMTYLSYGQGFRSGLPQDYTVGGVYAPAKPDRLRNYEWGIKGDAFDHQFAYSLSLYYMHWTGTQQTLSELSAGAYLPVVVNAPNASGPGVDLSLTLKPITGLDLNATLSWNNLTYDSQVNTGGTLAQGGYVLFDKGNRLGFSPEYTASVAIGYTFPIGSSGLRGRISASENYTSPLYTIYLINEGSAGIQPSNLPANSILTARAQIALIPSEHWTIALFADNLANYNGTLAGSEPAIYDNRATPRTVGVRVDYHLR